MTSDVKYTYWQSNPGGINTKKEITSKDHVLIKGGHGVAQRQNHGGLVTPQGVVTEVSDVELEFLKKDEVFQTHMKHGFVKILTPAASKIAEAKPEKVSKDMPQADKAAPLTDKDFQKGGRATIPEGAKIKEGKNIR
jgi:rRNA maturation endonuclease Nob1